MDHETQEHHNMRLEERARMFIRAGVLLEPVIEQHGLEDQQDGGSIFGGGTTITKVDQHVDYIMRVADWLMIREE